VTVVVDACVAAKWFLREPLRPEALSLLDNIQELRTTDLLVVEIVNIAWKKVVQGEIPHGEASLIAATIPRFFQTIRPSAPYAERALEIALALRHPVYDCFYLACAEEAGATLITADERLCRAAKDSAFAALVRPLREIGGLPP
jgi:predicted nucleic acid-binding protein